MESVAQDRPAQILEIYRDYLKPEAAPANRKLEKRAETPLPDYRLPPPLSHHRIRFRACGDVVVQRI